MAFFKRMFPQRPASAFHFKRDRGTPNPDKPPFAKLDEKYTRLLTSLPPTTWSTTKQILGFALGSQEGSFQSSSLTAVSIILGLEKTAIYNSLHGLRSVLNIPLKRAHVSFRDSFIEYLQDPARSKDFYIDADDACDDVVRRLAKLFLEKSCGGEWRQIKRTLSDKEKLELLPVLKLDAEKALRYAITGALKTQRGRGPFVSQRDRAECLDFLSQVNTVDFLDYSLWLVGFTEWLIRLWNCFPEELQDRKIAKVIPLRNLRVDHLGQGYRSSIFATAPRFLSLVDASRRFTEWLKTGQHYSPKMGVLVIGSTPEKRSAIFSHASGEQTDYCYMAYPY